MIKDIKERIYLQDILEKTLGAKLELDNKIFNYIGKQINKEDVIQYIKEFYSVLYSNNYNKIVNDLLLDSKYQLTGDTVDINEVAKLIHELSHKINIKPANFYYGEVISLTYERIFNVLNNKEANMLMIYNIINTSDIVEENSKATLLFYERYLLGYIYSLRLCECYFDDKNTFTKKIMQNRGNVNMVEVLLDYYDIKFGSSKTIKMYDKQINKVLKKV